MTLAEFFHMGGYAAYVWSSYAISLVVLVLNVWLPLRAHRKQRARIAQRLEQQEESR